jgi:hypothetical protein
MTIWFLKTPGAVYERVSDGTRAGTKARETHAEDVVVGEEAAEDVYRYSRGSVSGRSGWQRQLAWDRWMEKMTSSAHRKK